MREIETQSVRGLEVDDQFKFYWLLDGKVTRICTFKYLVDVVGGAASHGNGVRSIRKQAAFFSPSSPTAHQRKMMLCRKLNQPL